MNLDHDQIIKYFPKEVGQSIVDDAKRLFSGIDNVNRLFQSYPVVYFRSRSKLKVVSIVEQEDNIADLIVHCRYENGEQVTGKVFLPVIKSRPSIGFKKIDDRGIGIDLRMNLIRRIVQQKNRVDVPKAYYYDQANRVVWMEYIDTATRFLDHRNLPEIAKVSSALGLLHHASISEAPSRKLGNARTRKYLIEYPFRYLKPFLNNPKRQQDWLIFRDIDEIYPYALIHGDFAPKNILIDENSKIWFLDFDRSNFANPAYDLGLFIAGLSILAWDHLAPTQWIIETVCKHYFENYRRNAPYFVCLKYYIALNLAYRLASIDFIKTGNQGILEVIRNNLEKLLDISPEIPLSQWFN